MDDTSDVRVPKDIQTERLVAVEFPLAIKPSTKGLDAALGIIGGKEELSLVTADEERALKLNNRPKDPLCRPLVAQRNASEGSAFVFKVKRRRLRPKSGSEGRIAGSPRGDDGGRNESGDGWSIASVDVVGAVHTSFTFNSLADVQFVSCRPRDEGAEEAIEEHIAAAMTRTEPMELVPTSFLPPFPKVSQESRAEKLLRRERKQNEAVKLERGELLVHHHFGQDLKHRTKKGATLIKEARALEHLEEELNQKWGIGKKKNPERSNRPYRLKIGISGHNEVKEQKLMLVLKILKMYEKRPMLSMAEITELFDGDAVWPLRDVVPVVAYHICNGPWRSRWVRFGYRPEDHPVTRFEQIFEYRLSAGKLRIWEEGLGKNSVAAAAASRRRIRLGKVGNKHSIRGAVEAVNTDDTAEDGARSRGDAGDALSSKDTAEGMETLGEALPSRSRSGGDSVSEERKGGKSDSEQENNAAGRQSPDIRAGGVFPEIGRASTTKGRFASQVVLNGVQLSARNRQIICESPFRSVQELALASPRLDKPDSMTGWWPQRTIDKMRQLTLQGIEDCIRLKNKVNAAAGLENEGSKGRGEKGHRLPKNIPREEFFEAVSRGEHDVEIVQAPAPALPATAGVEAGAYGGVSSAGDGAGGLGDAVGRKVQGLARRGVEDDHEVAMDKADRDAIGTSDEEDSDSDDLNSSDLVDDTDEEQLFSDYEPSDQDDDTQSDLKST